MDVNEEIEMLKDFIKRLGKEAAGGTYEVTFGVLFADDDAANTFEAIVGTLKAAKKRKIIKYDSELLLQGVHDNVVITLL